MPSTEIVAAQKVKTKELLAKTPQARRSIINQDIAKSSTLGQHKAKPEEALVKTPPAGAGITSRLKETNLQPGPRPRLQQSPSNPTSTFRVLTRGSAPQENHSPQMLLTAAA